MRGSHDVQPLLAADLLVADKIAHPAGEDLSPTAGQRTKPGLLELDQHVVDRLSGQPGKVDDLAGGERLDVDAGRQLLETAQHLEVIGVGQTRILAAHDVDLGNAAGERLACFVEHLVDGERIGLGVAVVVTEGAEEAAVTAHVGVVDVAVADEVDV